MRGRQDRAVVGRQLAAAAGQSTVAVESEGGGHFTGRGHDCVGLVGRDGVRLGRVSRFVVVLLFCCFVVLLFCVFVLFALFYKTY